MKAIQILASLPTSHLINNKPHGLSVATVLA